MVVVLAMVCFASTGRAQPVTGALRAGADVRPVCTLSGVPLAGYGGAARRKTLPALDGYTFFFNPSTVVHDDVRVKTLVIEVAGQLFAFVSLDAIGFSANIAIEVESQLASTGLTRQNTMYMGSHTHSGPGAVTDRVFWQVGAADLFNQDVFDHIVGNIVASAQAALANLQDAKLGVDIDYNPLITENRRHPGAPVDARIGVIKVVDMADSPIAVLFNFAVHGTCLGGSNMEMSADNLGYAERFLEVEIPGVVPLFTNAAEGDVKPVQGGWTGAQYVGETLGAEVKAVWDTLPTDHQVTMEVQTSLEQLPAIVTNVAACDTTMQALLGTWLIQLPGELGETEELFMALRLNDNAFVTVPGEAITEVGYEIQNNVLVDGWDNVFIMGLANGYMGYVVSPSEYDLGDYEACGTLYGRDTGTFVVNRATAVGLSLTPPVQPQNDAGVDASTAQDAAAQLDAASSADASTDTADASTTQPPTPKSGCSCHTDPAGAPTWPLLLLLALVCLVTRRRPGPKG